MNPPAGHCARFLDDPAEPMRNFARYEALVAVQLKIRVGREVTQCQMVHSYRYFGG
jgi:hypothetical protein